MNDRRINDDANDETPLTHEEKRSSSKSYNDLINNDDDNVIDDNDNDDNDTSPVTFNLNKVLNRFGNNVELLELILTSKVEEDRRLTEEAKLKMKQLDYRKDKKSSKHYLLPSTKLPRLYNRQFSTDTVISSADSDSTPIRRLSFFSPNHLHHQNHYYTPESNDNHHSDSNEASQNKIKPHPLSVTHSKMATPLPFIDTPPDHRIKKATHFFTAPSLSTKASLSLSLSSSPSAPFPSLGYTNNQQTPSSSSFSIFSDKKSSINPSLVPPRDFSRQPDTINITPSPLTLPHTSAIITNKKLPIPQIPPKHHHHHHRESGGHSKSPSLSPSSRQPFKRRRREMQSITMIIETKEFPYNDNYNWKNNGNTVHKKSGQRSIYYKCSNATKGCHVNKTVTFKGQGEYLIKYRGKHWKNCTTSNIDPAATSSSVTLPNTESSLSLPFDS